MANQSLIHQFCSRFGQIAILIDPEKTTDENELKRLIEKASFAKIDYFFVGGSTVTRQEIQQVIHYLKAHTTIPVIIFPGSSHQLSNEADGLLYLSLVSGRNPDYLISHHVNSALEVYNLGIEVIPTGYILVDGGTKSSVAYVSQTTPIPQEQKSIALNTALAAQLQGKKLIYFDAGSGAIQNVPLSFIEELRKISTIPVVVGGGIKTVQTIQEFQKAQVNVVVIGNRIEEEIDFLLDIKSYLDTTNSH